MDYLTYIFSRRPDDVESPLLIDADRPGRSLSWKQYAAAVKSIAVGLRARGLVEGDVVGLISPNDLWYYVLGDAVIAAGATFAPISSVVKKTELLNCLAVAGVTWLCAAPDFLDLANSASASTPTPLQVMVFDPPGREENGAVAATSSSYGPLVRFSSLLEADGSLWENPYAGKNPKDLVALRQYTSGTTGSTKAVDVCHDTLIARIKRLDDKDLAPVETDEAALHYITMSNMSGQMTHAKAVMGKLRTYFTSADNGEALIDMIQRHGITMIQLMVPLMDDFTAAIHSGARSRESLRSLQVVLVGGAASRKEGVEAFAAILPSHAMLKSGYGSTEAASIATTHPDMAWEPGYVGLVVHDIELKIIDPETLEALSSDTEGEICVRGPRVFRRYANDAAATASSFLADADGGDAWYRTGDRGFLDAGHGGQLAITGRYKEIFKVRGQHVAPVEVEDELRRHPGVLDAAVASTADRRPGVSDEEAVAYVVRREGDSVEAKLTAQEVVDFVASRMARHKAPTGGVVFCERILRNSAGKIMRTKLAELPALPGSARYLEISV